MAVEADRIKYWLDKGAQMTPTVNNLLVGKNVVEGKKVAVSKLTNKSREAIAKKATDAKAAQEKAEADKVAAEAKAAADAAAPVEPAPTEEMAAPETAPEAVATEETQQ